MKTKTTGDIDLGVSDIRWDLSDLFSGPNDPKIEVVISETKAAAVLFSTTYKGRVGSLSSRALLAALQEKEALVSPYYQLSQYVHLIYSIDTHDDHLKSLLMRVEEVGSDINNQLLFFNLELGLVSQSVLDGFLSDNVLHSYHYKISEVHKKAHYKLTEKEEQMVNLKDLTGVQAANKLYDELSASFEFEFELDGGVKKMNGSELRALRQHENVDVRRRAMKLFFSRYETHQLTFTHLYNTIVKDFNIERKQRGYKTPISVMNIGNDLPGEAIDVLHQVTTESSYLVSRYYKLKQQLLNLPDMTLADIYAPIPECSKKYTWDESKAIVLNSFKAFDQEFYDHALDMYERKRIDAPVEPSKRGGAYCSSSTPDMAPYVMLNYLGRSRDISTISHELGHAIHAYYSKAQPLWSYHAILPLCETASVFSEMVLMDYMRQSETDTQAKIVMLTDKLEDLFATSHRQNMFSRFEQAAHTRITDGLMSTEDLNQLYESELQNMFGDSVTITPEYRWEWSTIPHIYHVPFYVYAYNFGNLLVIALYQQYLKEGKRFLPKLKQVLAMGSSASPIDITKVVGADITDANFWRQSLTYLEGLIDELESLISLK